MEEKKIFKKPFPSTRITPNSVEVIDARKLESLKRDVFPCQVLENFPEEDRLPRPSEFAVLPERHQIYPYIIYLTSAYKVAYCSVKYDDVIRKHFVDTLKYLMTAAPYTSRNWTDAIPLLQKPILKTKNVNHRTCFKFNIHFFLTKKYFTFGNRLVEPGTMHVIQTGKHPLCIYTLERKKRGLNLKGFVDTEQHNYRTVILAIDSIYIIPSGTVYVLYTTDRSFFSLHLLKEDVVLPFSHVTTIRSTQATYRTDDIYRVPVQTPCIETRTRPDDSSDSEEEFSTDPADLPEEAPAKAPMTSRVPTPPAATPGQPLVIIKKVYERHFPVEKNIVLLHTNLIHHLQRFMYKEYDDPRPPITFYATEDPVEVLDLSRTSHLDQSRASSPDLLIVDEIFSPTPPEESPKEMEQRDNEEPEWKRARLEPTFSPTSPDEQSAAISKIVQDLVDTETHWRSTPQGVSAAIDNSVQDLVDTETHWRSTPQGVSAAIDNMVRDLEGLGSEWNPQPNEQSLLQITPPHWESSTDPVNRYFREFFTVNQTFFEKSD